LSVKGISETELIRQNPDAPVYYNLIRSDGQAEEGWWIVLHDEVCGPFDSEEEADEAYEGGY
jgi:hypothetical protein